MASNASKFGRLFLKNTNELRDIWFGLSGERLWGTSKQAFIVMINRYLLEQKEVSLGIATLYRMYREYHRLPALIAYEAAKLSHSNELVCPLNKAWQNIEQKFVYIEYTANCGALRARKSV